MPAKFYFIFSIKIGYDVTKHNLDMSKNNLLRELSEILGILSLAKIRRQTWPIPCKQDIRLTQLELWPIDDLSQSVTYRVAFN